MKRNIKFQRIIKVVLKDIADIYLSFHCPIYVAQTIQFLYDMSYLFERKNIIYRKTIFQKSKLLSINN